MNSTRAISKKYKRWNYYILIFSIVFGVCFYDFIDKRLGFSFVDELLILACFCYWYYHGEQCKEFVFFWIVALFYLFYSLLFPHNVYKAILMDFFIEIKPFVCYYCIANLNFSISKKQAENIKNLCLILAFCFLPIGILSPGGGEYMDMLGMIHSRYATMMTILGLSYYIYSSRRKENLYISIIIIAMGMLSLRSKSYAFSLFYVLIMSFLGSKVKTIKILTTKRLFIFVSSIILVFYAVKEKLFYYFIEGGFDKEGEMFARPLLYKTAVDILKDFPFFGSGLGSYANYSTRVYYSPLYAKYGIDNVWGLSEDLPVFTSDTYFPVYAQFGFIGIFLFLLFWTSRIREGLYLYRRTKDMYILKMTILFTFFFFIESVVDSTLLHNRGAVMMMLFAIVLYNDNRKTIQNEKIF